ncbi:hypothetical protein GUJ93_ZPchr0013g37718 [Zizania palustris]|uniref:Uncharacterized protein n=1 Tax=Zizania palustris TaxID=103762 RepID=A0A8J5X8I1_ZIZPA|nr:hypothetical protein GUJ93_ZPchr0013g37718 [Zizania palustris]
MGRGREVCELHHLTRTGHLNVTHCPHPASFNSAQSLSLSQSILLLPLSPVKIQEVVQEIKIEQIGCCYLFSCSSRLLLIMPCAAELANGEAGAVKVGTTGTIGSLMTRELEAVRGTPPPPQVGAVKTTTTATRLRRQSSPVSVPCGASPRKIISLRKSSSNVSSASGGGRTDRVSAEEEAACNCKPRRSSQRSTNPSSPMLRSDGVLVDRSVKAKKKAAAACRLGGGGVQVVDVRCGNPMSSRLRRLGFSKLSETFA